MPASSTSSHIIKLKFENNYLTPCMLKFHELIEHPVKYTIVSIKVGIVLGKIFLSEICQTRFFIFRSL